MEAEEERGRSWAVVVLTLALELLGRSESEVLTPWGSEENEEDGNADGWCCCSDNGAGGGSGFRLLRAGCRAVGEETKPDMVKNSGTAVSPPTGRGK